MRSPFKQRKEVKRVTVLWNGAYHLTFKLVLTTPLTTGFNRVLDGCTLQLIVTILKVEQIEKYTLNMQEETLPSSK